jgi:20S proteasome alpha/beta subunit
MLVQGCTCGLHGRALAMTHESVKRLRECALNHKPIRRLPYQPRKPYIRPPRRNGDDQAMTLVVGIKYKGGVVLGADQAISTTGYKHLEQKISLVGDDKASWYLFLGYSGIPSWAKEAKEKIENNLQSIQAPVTEKDIRDAVEGILNDMVQRYNSDNLQMLIAACTEPNEPVMWVFKHGAFHTLIEGIESIGAGDSPVIKYLSEAMYSASIREDEAKNLAVYLVAQAKKYILGVEGPSDIVDIGVWGPDWMAQTEVEQRLKKMETKVSTHLKEILS